jgi:hypothetical protein
MVVMFVDCCVGVYSTFRTISTVESYGAGVFVPARTLIATKLLTALVALICQCELLLHYPFVQLK